MINLKEELAKLKINSKSKWGVEQTYEVPKFEGLPFQLFNRMNQNYHITDFYQSTKNNLANQDEEYISITKKQSKQQYIGQRQKKNLKLQYDQAIPLNDKFNNSLKDYSKQRQKKKQVWKPYVKQKRTRFGDTVKITGQWTHIKDLQKNDFEPKFIKKSGIVFKDIVSLGKIRQYNRRMEKCLKKGGQKIITQTSSDHVIGSTTFDDPQMIDIISQDAELKTDRPTLYTTDAILAAVMTMKNSQYPWHIFVTKNKDQIILDKTLNEEGEGEITYLDLESCSENNTSRDMPEEEKELLRLCTEATNISKSFIGHCTSKTHHRLGKKLEGDVAIGYKYRRITLTEEKGKPPIDIVVRSEVDSFITLNDGTKRFLLLKTFNQEHNTEDWRRKIHTQKGKLIGQQLMDQQCKIMKWLCKGYLAGVEHMKIGWVVRAKQQNKKSTIKHEYIAVDDEKVSSLSRDLGFKFGEIMGFVKQFFEQIYRLGDGRYVITKPPYRKQFRIYKVPSTTVQEEEEVE